MREMSKDQTGIVLALLGTRIEKGRKELKHEAVEKAVCRTSLIDELWELFKKRVNECG